MEKNGLLAERIKKDEEAKQARQSVELIQKQHDSHDGKESPVTELTKENIKKEARMSLRISPELKQNFAKINQLRGVSNNSAMNMLMSDYVEKYLYMLKK